MASDVTKVGTARHSAVRSALQPSQLAGTILGAIEKAADTRWEPALKRADATSGTTDERIRQVRAAFARELTTVGAASGGVAAVPGAGTVAAVASAVADLGWVTLRTSGLIFTVAAIHGHGRASVEERKAWVLTILAFGDSASVGFTKLSSELGKGLGRKATSKISGQTLRRLNAALGRTVVTKYGTKRGAIALGRALPFGFGAAIGGGANYLGVRAITRQADKFFTHLPIADPVP